MYHLLFVCTGNICRSPTAEAIFRHKAVEKGLENRFVIDSAGTHGYHVGDAPDHRSIATAKQRGVDMASLSARKVSSSDFEKFDMILALDEGHYRHLKALKPEGSKAELVMFLDYLDTHKGQDVPDPYYGDQKGFDHVCDLIERGSEGLLGHLLKNF